MRADLDKTGETTLIGCQLSVVFYSNKSHFRFITLQILEQGNNKMKEVFSKEQIWWQCLESASIASCSFVSHIYSKDHQSSEMSFRFFPLSISTHHYNPNLCQESLKDRKAEKRSQTRGRQNSLDGNKEDLVSSSDSQSVVPDQQHHQGT